ncbi:hypothetical protein L198_03587 [Cryptococcus wingfieldii CBS 7118]|uniref:Helitron helicase-like domain-containing protein n=1 Tax=Cryptococcus wingfieldii CBS 7118 TaxID=1295528 RepID=A0A1E3JBU2_9TREE|nr:hypothetical protein L198_03587 [Cryptococcus wingfieldii CBS 7118]ODN98343.1 hypothetical protein L198_03587 [Cryptococcus wingfieldii CBS 7118]
MTHVADSRKISAFMSIKNGGKFLVYPSGSTPMREWASPDTFAALLPDLFPYGCGVFEDPLRPKKDRRFAMHTTFPFICLNIIQRRQSSYQASLQTPLSTFDHLAPLLEAVTVDTLASIQAKLAKLKPGVRFNPETEAEKGATALLRKVTLMSSSMFGSVGSHRNMREELRALLRDSGMPSLFVTLNPADSKNFVVSVMAGRDVDLDERLGLGDEVKEEVSQRFSAASTYHGACAEGFHFMVEKFIDVFLAYGSPEGGIFGKCLNHYGVVEAQGRGALHIHMLIWLEHAPSPLELRKHAKEDPEWAAEVGRYPPCDDDALAFRQRGEHWSLPLLQPPPHLPPDMSEEDWQRVRQDVLEVLECGQLHDHSFTCFKHLPKLRRAQKEEVLQTHFNDDGTIDIKRTHPKLNMYNLILVAAFCCNMDIKFVGSGMMGMAAVYYISNYISKVALDTPTMFAAIEARFRRLQRNAVS